MEMKAFLFLISLFSIAFLIILFQKSTKNICLTSLDCEWKITNCCTEQAGAKWECVNKKTFVGPECPKFVICPQFLSPKPNLSCRCENNKCVVR